MRSFRNTVSSSIKIFAAMHLFNGTADFSDVKISSHPILPTLYFSVYFKTGFWICVCIELKKTNGRVINSAVGRP